jgi:hypothetical protein
VLTVADEAGEDECTRLIEEALAAAKRLLEEEGQFRPFALTRHEKGGTEIVMPQASDGEGSSQDDLEALRADLGAEAAAGAIGAAAIALNAWIHAPDRSSRRDAVIVFAEHRAGLSLQANQIYDIEERHGDAPPGGGPTHAVTWGELTVDVVESSIFAAR